MLRILSVLCQLYVHTMYYPQDLEQLCKVSRFGKHLRQNMRLIQKS